MPSTYIIIAGTAIISFMAFNNPELKYKLIFYPYKMNHERNEWFRFISSGLIHADFGHLIFNMITLFFFGPYVESGIRDFGGPMPEFKFWLLYLGSMIMGSMFSYYKNQHNPNYMALGASGAVSGVLFSSILFAPWNGIGIFFIPIRIPAIIFGVGYLWYSAYMSKNSQSNIGHDAHFYGALAGVVLTIAYNPSEVLNHFFEQLKHNPYF